jgi:hypothetical protein
VVPPEEDGGWLAVGALPPLDDDDDDRADPAQPVAASTATTAISSAGRRASRMLRRCTYPTVHGLPPDVWIPIVNCQ